MESLRNFYRIGSGPSSSHTMGPEKAAKLILTNYPNATYFEVVLYGSLAFTGIGHLTDVVLKRTLGEERTKVIFDYKTKPIHPNLMKFLIYQDGNLIDTQEIISIGGGEIRLKGEIKKEDNIYPLNNLEDIIGYVNNKKEDFASVVFDFEDENMRSFLDEVYQAMKNSIQRGLITEGTLPGGLNVKRKAKKIYNLVKDETPKEKEMRMISAYAYSVAEENASGGIVVTAPTCGAAGIIPALLYYYEENLHLNNIMIENALAVAGIIGNVVKNNAAISGAYAGCQSEIGTACSMGAAMISYLKGGTNEEIESAAEIAMEHHLGLTCDPVQGLVQIPCIERNAIGALSSVDSALVASLPIYPEKMSFDSVVETMLKTGKDLGIAYRETARGGLAKSKIKEE